MMAYLVEHEAEIYPRIAAMGEKVRRTIESTFAQVGIYAYCTGRGTEAITGSSLLYVHFPYKEGARPDRPEELFDPSLADTTLSDKVVHQAFLLEDVHLLHGHGAVSTAHTDADAAKLEHACRKVARRIKKHL
jgi:glutamate-1-semialdehyde aminotransferase